ncbi:threonine ammonia-lyase [Paenibacillus kandeliae]|uniref:threonine ammonia-lyase n=1 Tax=Paenibacillus kandeliae TaxID=3231269 RepID=UPI0034579FDC
MMLTAQHIVAAQQTLQGHLAATPIETSHFLNERTGRNIWIKPEYKQHTGSFKYRGAFHFLSHLDQERYHGVVAGSSGNHGIAVSAIAEQMGIPATICMADDSSMYKRERILQQQAKVMTFNRMTHSRELLVQQLAEQQQLCIIPSAAHPLIMAGAGTIALDMLSEMQAAAVELDAIIVPVGGGGLASGVAVATHEVSPRTRIIGVEPLAGNDAQLSLRAGKIVQVDAPQTMADGLRHRQLEQLPFQMMQQHLDDIVTVSESEIQYACELAQGHLGWNIEPTSAVVIAALLFATLPSHWNHIGIVLTGANMQPVLHSTLSDPVVYHSATY